MEIPTFIESYDCDFHSREYMDDFCDRVINRLEHYLASPDMNSDVSASFMKGEESNNSPQNRVDYSINFHTIFNEPLTNEIHSVLQPYLSAYGDKYPSFKMFNAYSNTVKVQKTYPKGGFHIWHKEHAGNAESIARVLTWTIYLNDVPDGEGETEFLEYGIKVTPKRGRVCLFPAAWQHTHRGNPVYSCNKYIATGWYYYG